MPIIDLQRRLREVGRIRLGVQVATAKGGRRPAKLETFRLTSRDQRVIHAAAELYGGTATPWAAPDGQQWEVTTEALELEVIVPPGDMAFSQWLELWSGGGCLRRCDGVTEYLGDRACLCDPSARECSTTTRLNVMLPDVPGFGLWRVETHGYYAATELAGVVELCRQASEAGQLLPARLRLEQRQVKRTSLDGKSETFRFAVPVLDLDVSPAQLMGGSTGGWSPVPVAELPPAPTASLGEQLSEAKAPAPRRPRANAATPIPPTGLKPRTAAEVGQALGAEVVTQVDTTSDAKFLMGVRKAAVAAGWEPPKTVEEARALAPQLPTEDAPAAPAREAITEGTRRKMFALAGDMWATEDEETRRKLLLDLAAELGHPGLTSRTQIDQGLASELIDNLTEMLAVR